MKLLGFGSLSEPRGVRAEFCDFCTTIGPHWAYDLSAIQKNDKPSFDRNNNGSFQLCQICSARTALPERVILMPRASATGLDIEQLIERTNPALFDEGQAERIANRLAANQTAEARKQLALQAFARAQEDLATDTLRLADLRIWGGLFIGFAIFFRVLRRIPRGGGLLLFLVIFGVLIYRFLIVPRLVRINQRPAWIRLLTGTTISFGELFGFLKANRDRFPRTNWLLKAKEYRSLGDDGYLFRDANALKTGHDFLPASGSATK